MIEISAEPNPGRCPYCGAYVRFELLDARGNPLTNIRVYNCPNCQKYSVALQPALEAPWSQFPLREIDTIAYVPPQVMGAYREAWRSLEAGAPRAAATMLRRTVASACSEQGIPDSIDGHFVPLSHRIDQLQPNLIPATYHAARNTKLLGDAGAHEEAEDNLGPITTETVALAMTVVRQILANLYELPGQVSGMNAMGGGLPAERP
jgi:uncharacterized protein DUF4145